MGARESPVQDAVRDAVVRSGVALLWRNSVGYDAARRIRYGLGVGSADLIGVRRRDGAFVAIEVKAPRGRVDRHQRQWGDAVLSAGGIYLVARSAEEALRGLG